MLGCQSVRLIHLLWSSQTPSGEQEKLTINDALSVSRYSSRRKIEVSAVPDQSSPAHPIEPPASAWPAKRRIAPMAMLSPVSIFSMPALTSSLRSSNGSSPISPFSIKERGLGADVGLSKREKALFASPTQLDIESRSGQVAEIGAPLTPISVDVLKEEQEKKQEMEMETNVNALEVKSAPQYVAHMFKWKQGGNFVKVTGTFDKWEKTIVMKKSLHSPDHFESIVSLDRSQNIQFKFIVDGQWRCTDEFGTGYDTVGHLNNVLPAI